MDTNDVVPQIADALAANLTEQERAELDGAITPRVAELFAKAFGDQMWDILVPLTEDYETVPAQEPDDFSGPASTETGEARLRALMRDPRYWRDRDPNFVAKVASGFDQLFPNKA